MARTLVGQVPPAVSAIASNGRQLSAARLNRLPVSGSLAAKSFRWSVVHRAILRVSCLEFFCPIGAKLFHAFTRFSATQPDNHRSIFKCIRERAPFRTERYRSDSEAACHIPDRAVRLAQPEPSYCVQSNPQAYLHCSAQQQCCCRLHQAVLGSFRAKLSHP